MFLLIQRDFHYLYSIEKQAVVIALKERYLTGQSDRAVIM